MFAVGDIVAIVASTTGYKKYHLCVHVGTDGAAHRFLFLNSDPSFAGTFVVPCARVPCIPPSDTGNTAFSFNMMPRYNDNQLKLFKAEKKGALDKALAAELALFADHHANVKGLNSEERATVRAAFKFIIES